MSAMLAAPHPVEVLTRYLGPAPGRRMSRGSWWSCPFHSLDRNPSLHADQERWFCHGCKAGGDSISFVRKYLNCTFPEALAELGLDEGPRPRTRPRPPQRAPQGLAPPVPSKDWRELASEIIADCCAALWGPRGGDALQYLRTKRLLSDESIRIASLGYNPDWRPLPEWLKRPDEDRVPSLAPGITIPCRGAGGIELVNVRRPEGSEPKYVAMRGSRRGGIFPGPDAIRPGRPLVIVEGEFDALLLGQCIGDVAGVITIGSASASPSEESRNRLVFAPVIFAAHDDDPAGDEAAARLSLPARRERPPGAKDWTDAARNGVDLRAWWAPVLEISDDHLAESAPMTPAEDPAVAAALSFMDEGEVDLWQERAGDLQFDGAGMPREQAERHALRQVRPDLYSRSFASSTH